jgi:hypothetical protein
VLALFHRSLVLVNSDSYIRCFSKTMRSVSMTIIFQSPPSKFTTENQTTFLYLKPDGWCLATSLRWYFPRNSQECGFAAHLRKSFTSQAFKGSPMGWQQSVAPARILLEFSEHGSELLRQF